MQDLMSLIREQSKLIGSLQKTIENLNSKLKKLENVKDISKDGKNVQNVSINVTTGSKNDHIKPVHEIVKTSKCQEGFGESGNVQESRITCHFNNTNVLVTNLYFLYVNLFTLKKTITN